LNLGTLTYLKFKTRERGAEFLINKLYFLNSKQYFKEVCGDES
jgi:hypothetical protein